MAEQCVIGIEDSQQQQPAPASDASDSPPHPASPLSRIESPTVNHQSRDDVDGAVVDAASTNGASTPTHSTASGAGGVVTPFSSLIGDSGDGVERGVGADEGWLFAGSVIDREHHHPLLQRSDSRGSVDIDSHQRSESTTTTEHELKEPRQQPHLEVPAFLETPVVERMDETTEHGASGAKLLIISDKLAAAKPKRLSDEFFSADDNEEDEEEEEDDDQDDEDGADREDDDNDVEEGHHRTLDSSAVCLQSGGDCETQASLNEIKNLSITCDGNRNPQEAEAEAAEPAGTSTKEQANEEELQVPTGSKDAMPLLGDALDDHQQNRKDVEYIHHHHHNGEDSEGDGNDGDETEDEDHFLDDVQSMDAIERRDFEQEQRLTGGFLIRNRSLISADRLNLEFLNTINQPSQSRSPNGGDEVPTSSSSSENAHTDGEGRPSNEGRGGPCAQEEELTASVGPAATFSASTLPCASPTSATTCPTAVHLTTTPTSSRYQHKHDPHFHHHHHHHHQQKHQHNREGKQQQQAAKNGGPGSDSFSSSYSRETQHNSTTKSAVHKLTRNLSASLTYCNEKRKDANVDEGEKEAGGTVDDLCGAPSSDSSGAISLSHTSSVSSSVSSLASSSNYSSLYASASGSTSGGLADGIEHSAVEGGSCTTDKEHHQQQHHSAAPSLSGKGKLAEAFLKAITNNSLLAARAAETLLRGDVALVELPPESDQLEMITNNTLLAARAAETLLRDGLIVELPGVAADKASSLEPLGKATSTTTASSTRSSSIITATTDFLAQEDESAIHDPCSTASSNASYSSSSSPSPPQTQHGSGVGGDVSMLICTDDLPPTASLSGSTASSTTPTECGTSAPDLHAAVPSTLVTDEMGLLKSMDVHLEPTSSCAGEETRTGEERSASISCQFSKDDGAKQAAALTSSSSCSTGSTGGKVGQSSQHHQQRRPYHHHHHHHQHHRAAAGGDASSSSAASSSATASRRSVVSSGSRPSASPGKAVIPRPSPPGLGVATVAPEKQGEARNNSASAGPAFVDAVIPRPASGLADVAAAAAPGFDAVIPQPPAGLGIIAVAPFQQRDASTNTSNSPESSEPEIDEEDWADCEEGTDEEVCTCRDYTDEEGFASSEDELPSRDVDLSSYTHLDAIPEDLLHEAQTPRLHRKRKLTENRTASAYGESGNPSTETLNNYSSRKRLALDGSASSTVATSGGGTSSSCASGATGGLTSANGGVVMATTPRSSLRSPMNIATTPTSSTLGERKTPRTIIPTKDNPPPELNEWLLQFQRWTHVERLVAVDRLIEHCEPTQVRHMMKVIEPQFQRDFISLLPKELALQVLSYLEPKDLLRAAQTCRSWRFLADDNLLWKEKCKEGGIVIEPSTDRPKRGRTGNMPPISSPWKAAYMRQHIIEMNWRSRPIRTAKVLKGHDDHVITCLQFCGNRIVSGSDDNTLKVWSAITGKCLRTLTGHTGGVWSSQMAGNVIISGSTDRTLRVWNADTGQCMHILHGHTSTVRCMHLHGNKVVSGSRDATLRVWDVNLGTCLHMLVGHLAAVRCVQYDGKLIVSGAYDYMVKVWNPERQECLHTLQGHTNRVYSLQFDGVHVVSGSLDTSIRVWDAETGSCKHALMGHQSLTSGMELRQNILVSGNADSTVKVWDIITGQCLQTLSGPNKHQSAVTCLQFNSRFVITSSDDGTVKLWDVKTGDFIRNLVALESGGSGGVVWRIRANDTKLICAVGSRNGTEETKLMVLDFDVEGACLKCS